VATLTNPINAQNIIDRFEDYVRATANSGISWYNGPSSVSKPFPEFPDALLGPLPGQSRSISGAGFPGTPIIASTIYNVLIAETNRYTQIRLVRAMLNIQPQSPSTNKTREATESIDVTAVAHCVGFGSQSIATLGSYEILRDKLIKAGGKPDRNSLEDFFFDLRAAYVTARNIPAPVSVNVCHSSCHSSCHGSRGRR
jgi:hypothetical protein